MVADLVKALGPWAWVVLGVALIGLEALAPGAFLLWLGLAALVTGLLDGLFGLSWQASALNFAGLCVTAVLIGRSVTRHRGAEEGGGEADRPVLNRRGHALVGQVFTLNDAIAGGQGRVRVDDSSWRVVGPDMPAGERVRVVRIDGATLVVEGA